MQMIKPGSDLHCNITDKGQAVSLSMICVRIRKELLATFSIVAMRSVTPESPEGPESLADTRLHESWLSEKCLDGI